MIKRIVSAFGRLDVPVQQRSPSPLPSRHIDAPTSWQLNGKWQKANGKRQKERKTLLNQGLLLFLIFAICLLPFNFSFASGPGSTTAELLKIPIGTRAIGMGEAYTALADDSSALWWNPAGLSSLDQKEAAFMQSSLIENINYEHLGYAQPGDAYAWGGSMAYLGYGSIAGYDNNGNPIGNQTAYSYVMNGAMSTVVLDKLSLGLGGEFVHENLAQVTANTGAANLGALYPLPSHLWNGNYRLGVSALNLGPGLKFDTESDPLPRRFQLGAAAMHIENWPLNLTMDLTIPNDNDTYISLGSEYWFFKDVLALRLGYTGENTASNGLRLGVGLKIYGINFDYAYGSFGDFGATHRFSLSYRFGSRVEQLNKEERAILKEAKKCEKEGNYVQAILDYNEILDRLPADDHILHQMINDHEAMLNKELHEAVAQATQPKMLSPEEAALSDLIPGQAVAQTPAALGDPMDLMGYDKLPDVNTLDVPIQSLPPSPQALPPSASLANSAPISTAVPATAQKAAPPPRPALATPAAPDFTKITPSNIDKMVADPTQMKQNTANAPVDERAPVVEPSARAAAENDQAPALSPADIYGN
jgi:hypothetical protein